MAADTSPDRRNFYRIEDHVGIEVRRLPANGPGDTQPFDDDHLDGLRAELKRLDAEVRSQLASLAEKDRQVAALVKSLNGKVDTLARIMAFEQNPLQPHHWQTVTLSEGGIAFLHTEGEFSEGDLVALRLTLPPELFRPQLMARVIELAGESPGQVRVHAEFEQIDDSARQQIARHVMRWQIRQRQQDEPSAGHEPQP